MFRIKERDGTSFVYDVDTGNLAMIIKTNNKENNVKEEQVVISGGKKGQLLPNSLNKSTLLDKYCPSVKLPKVTYCNDDSDDVLSETEFKKRFGTRCNKDLYVPVYDQNSFLKIFNLIPTSSGVLSIPRVDDDDDEDSTDLYGNDQQQLSRTALSNFDFTSALGQSILRRKRDCNVFVRDASACVAKYDKYCLPTKRNTLPEGLLRDRQGNMVYHVSYVRRTRANGHKYSFNKKQRLERLKVINTGLNKRARLLKLLCRDVKVKLYRLSETDIRTWTTSARNSSAPPGFTLTSRCGERDTSLQPCIDGTIVIQLDDSEDEAVTVSPKPMLSPCFNQVTQTLCRQEGQLTIRPSSTESLAVNAVSALSQTFRWQDGRLTIVPSSTGLPTINTAHPIFTNGLTLRAVPQPNPSSAASNFSLLKPSALNDVLVPTARSQASSSDSEDSEIEFLGCVPRVRSAPTGISLASHILGANTDKVPRFLVTNLCQPTLETKAASSVRENLNHALQHAATSNGIQASNGSHVSSLNRRKIGSPGTLKVPISPYNIKTRFHSQINSRNLDKSPFKAADRAPNNSSSSVMRSTRLQRGFESSHSSNERIDSDFNRLEADLERLLGRLNRRCALQKARDALPEVRELAVNFQCHMCGFEEKHYHSASKRMTRHMDKYHGEMDGVVRLMVNVQVSRNDPPSIVVQAVSCDAPPLDHTATASHAIINL